MAAPCPLLSDGITDDTLLHIAGFLSTARDLLSLCLTCPRFAAKVIAAPIDESGGRGGAAAAPEMLSIPEEAARLWLAGCSEQERGWVPRRDLESLVGLMQGVELLREPLVFGRAHASFTLSEGGAVATKSVAGPGRAAASQVVMRSGRHFARFTVVHGRFFSFGVIRAAWDVEGGGEAYTVDGHCFFRTYDGCHFPGFHNWEGMQTAREQGDRIGILLDLDRGSMTVWKNDEKLGAMVAEGLSGPLCWAVSLGDVYGAHTSSVRIESAPLPNDDAPAV